MAKKEKMVDSATLHHANLAVLAEQAGNYEDAANQWRKASETSPKPDVSALYAEAAKRCDRRLNKKI